MRAAINAALQALASNNSGIAAPTTTYAYMFWVDTSTATPTLKQRDAGNTAWVSLFQLSSSQWLFVNDILINGVTIGLGGGNDPANIVFGADALKNNIGGTANFAFGKNALINNTTGSVNIAMSLNALAGITIGSSNIGIGTDAGRWIGSGIDNTDSIGGLFIGQDSRPKTFSSIQETVIGSGVIGGGNYTTTIGVPQVIKTILRGEVITPAHSTGFYNQTTATLSVTGSITTIKCNRAGTITLTLPDAATYPGRILEIKTITAQLVVSASANVIPSIGGAATTAILPATAGKYAKLQSDGINWQIMIAN
jgi:hypothetical protein